MAKIISKIKTSNNEYGIRAGYMYYGLTTGTESALTVTITDESGNTISIPELVKGMTFALILHVIPSTSATLSVNGLTGKPIQYGTGLTGKEWVVGETYQFVYNGTAFVAMSTYDDYTVTTSGSGNAITKIEKSGKTITATKGSTFLTAHPTITKSTDTTSTQSVAHQGSFKVIDSITTDTNGHVTKVNTKTVTLPSDVGEVNQNAFSNVVVGSTTIAADSKTDTLTLVAGSNITLTPDATNDKITIAATDTNTHNLSKNIVGAQNATANSAKGNGSVYLTHIENSEVTSSHQITGSGGTTVKSDSSGNITINSTTYSNQTAASGGTAVSLVTTGEKYIWNNKASTTVASTSANGLMSSTDKSKLDGIASGAEVNVQSDWDATSGDAFIKNKPSSLKNPQSLTVGSKTYDGSTAITITAQDLGLDSALKYCGVTTTKLDDGATTNPIVINSANHKATTGCVVFYESKEFVYDGAKWNELGDGSNHKIKQTAVSSPSASGSTAAFIDTISQDANGKITATKKNVSVNITANATDDDVVVLTGSSGANSVTYDAKHAQKGPSSGYTSGNTTYTISGSGGSGTIKIPQITVDKYGHVTAAADESVTITLPTLPTVGNGKIFINQNGTEKGTFTLNQSDEVTINLTDTNTWRPISDSVSTTDSATSASLTGVKTAYDKAVSAYNLANSKTANTGTVTSITPGTGLTGTSSDTAITTSGTINLKAATSSEIGGISIGYTQSGKNYPVVLDSNNKAYVNVPWTDNNTDTHYKSLNIVGASDTATANAKASNGNVYLNHVENGAVTSKHKITGSGATTVTSDDNGNIIITSTDNNTDTKNTAGSTDTSSKIFLIGATSQAANPQTYSHDTAYVGTDGCLYSNSTKVSVQGHTHSYAGSSSAGGAATSAVKLSTARSIGINGGVTGTPTNFDGTGNISIPVTGVSEAYLTWGGKNHSASYGPIDAAMIPELGANRLAFTPADKINIEYSQDGGSTWKTYSATNANKLNLFSVTGANQFYIGGSAATGVDKSKHKLRVTVNTAGSIYSTLNKFMIYCSTNGSSGTYCTISARLQTHVESNTETWNTFANQIAISGWSGYNIINTSGITTYGNTIASQYGQLRFEFGVNSSSSQYGGLYILNIYGYGGVGWTCPSTMAKTGHLYSYDASQNATFPAQITATQFNGLATNASRLSNTTAIGSATQPVYFTASGVPAACSYTLGASVPSTAVFTDTKVTAVGNHYTPSGGSAATATASGSTLSFGGAVITGVTKDAAGHVTGVTTSKLPDNPNTWRPIGDNIDKTDSETSASLTAVKTAYDKAIAAYNLADSKTANTGTVTKISTGAGLTGGNITGTGTIKANLNSETSLGTIGTTSKLYAVGVDANNKLCVNVPWTDTDTNTHNLSKNIVGAQNATANSAKGNGSVYLTHIENSEVTSSHQIQGYGATTVKSDSDGNIIISSTNTQYSQGTGISISGATINHSNSITAGSVGAAASPSHGGTFAIPKITYDAQGHITAATTVNITLPTVNNATVTIKQNNNSKGSFTLNQTSPATINLTDTVFEPSDRLRVSGQFLQDPNGELETFTCDSDVENPYVTFSLTDAAEGEKLIHGRQLQLVGESGVSIRGTNEGKIFFNVDGGVGEQGPRGYQGYQGYTGTNGTTISEHKQTTSSTADGGKNVYTIKYSNGTSSTMTLYNGSKGTQGYQGYQGYTGADGSALTYNNQTGTCSAGLTWDISSKTRSYTAFSGNGTITLTSSRAPIACNEHYLLIYNCGGSAETGVVTFQTSIGNIIAKSATINVPADSYVEVSVVYLPTASFGGQTKATLVLTYSDVMKKVN